MMPTRDKRFIQAKDNKQTQDHIHKHILIYILVRQYKCTYIYLATKSWGCFVEKH